MGEKKVVLTIHDTWGRVMHLTTDQAQANRLVSAISEIEPEHWGGWLRIEVRDAE